MKQNVKRLPYGINDFEAVIEQNQYYVDKTMYLPLLENNLATSSSFVHVGLVRAYS